MQKNIEDTVICLKELIDKNGPSYLTDKPYEAYEKLIETGAADRKTAAALLHFLVSTMLENISPDYDEEIFSRAIQGECSLNKKMADRLALIMYSLYSGEHKRDWRRKDLEGLRQFLAEEFVCNWKGFAVWDARGGTVDCYYEAEIVLTPTESIKADKELAQQLKKNPFLTKEAIHNLFVERLVDFLNRKFDYYCTDDDYYQPVVEDYACNLEDDLLEWCRENGFEYVSSDGEGDDGGYEPKFRNGWY